MRKGFINSKYVFIAILFLLGCNDNKDKETEKNELLGKIITYGRKTDKSNDYYFEIILPDSQQGRIRYPRLSKDPLLFILFISIDNESIRNTNIDKLIQAKINTDTYETGGSLELRVLYGADRIVNKIMKMNKYELANQKDEILAEVFRIHREYKEEFNKYFKQEFKTAPEQIIIYEEEYNFDKEIIRIGNRTKRLTLKEANEFFNNGEGGIGNRKVFCTLVRKIKMDTNNEPIYWSITNKRVKTLREDVYNKDGRNIFTFDFDD